MNRGSRSIARNLKRPTTEKAEPQKAERPEDRHHKKAKEEVIVVSTVVAHNVFVLSSEIRHLTLDLDKTKICRD